MVKLQSASLGQTACQNSLTCIKKKWEDGIGLPEKSDTFNHCKVKYSEYWNCKHHAIRNNVFQDYKRNKEADSRWPEVKHNTGFLMYVYFGYTC